MSKLRAAFSNPFRTRFAIVSVPPVRPFRTELFYIKLRKWYWPGWRMLCMTDDKTMTFDTREAAKSFVNYLKQINI